MKTETIVITISANTHQKLVALPILQSCRSSAVGNNDGTVSFPVDRKLYDDLLYINPDIEMAIHSLLGLKTN